MKLQPQPVLVTDWSQEPLYLSHERVSQITGLSKRSIERRVRENTFRPLPCFTFPMRWSRAEFERVWRGENTEPVRDRNRRLA